MNDINLSTPIQQAFEPTEAVVTYRYRSCGISNINPFFRYYSEHFDVQINEFTIQRTNPPSETKTIGYCMNHALTGPEVGTLLESQDPYEALDYLSEQQVNQMLWILMNSYPATTAANLFAQAGVDASIEPTLIDIDAFAATQIALWVIETGEPYYSLQYCGTSDTHIKSARLAATAQYLVTQARAYGNQPPVDPAVSIILPNGSSHIIENNTIYMGPLQVISNTNHPIQITAQDMFNATIVNSSFVPQNTFYSNDLFYVAFPFADNNIERCVNIQASIVGTRVTPHVMFAKDSNGNPLPTIQDVGTIVITPETVLAQDNLIVCTPCKPCPCKPCPCEPCPPPPCQPCIPCSCCKPCTPPCTCEPIPIPCEPCFPSPPCRPSCFMNCSKPCKFNNFNNYY